MSPENPAPVAPAAKSPERFQSFTGPASVRYPAPDVARGFMLLLIALANAPFWMVLFRTRAEVTGADTIWMGLRAALVDHRSYPLFAMLFGFGLATMARRCTEAGPRSTAAAAADADPAASIAASTSATAATARSATAGVTPAATGMNAARRAAPAADARRLIRGRGLWMLVFAAVHGALFMGDIIGAYALIAVVLAGPIAGRGRRTQAVVGVLSAAVCLGYMLYIGWFLSVGGVTLGTAGAAGGVVGGIAEMLRGPLYPAVSLVLWAGGTMVTILTSLTLPAALLGVRLADTDLLTRPDRHRRALLVGGAAALAVGAAGALPRILPSLGIGVPARVTVVASALDVATGMVGACGWLALLAAWADPGTGAPLRGAHWLLSAVGRRSMTVYIGQTVLFALIFGTLRLTGAPAFNEVMGASVAVAVWAALAMMCAWMERSGRTRGPLEILLRRAVAASARRR